MEVGEEDLDAGEGCVVDGEVDDELVEDGPEELGAGLVWGLEGAMDDDHPAYVGDADGEAGDEEPHDYVLGVFSHLKFPKDGYDPEC